LADDAKEKIPVDSLKFRAIIRFLETTSSARVVKALAKFFFKNKKTGFTYRQLSIFWQTKDAAINRLRPRVTAYGKKIVKRVHDAPDNMHRTVKVWLYNQKGVMKPQDLDTAWVAVNERWG
jgi:hypothetical protein